MYPVMHAWIRLLSVSYEKKEIQFMSSSRAIRSRKKAKGHSDQCILDECVHLQLFSRLQLIANDITLSYSMGVCMSTL